MTKLISTDLYIDLSMHNQEILIISSTFPPNPTSLGKRLGDLLSFFPKDKYTVLINKENKIWGEEFNFGKTFYFSGSSYLEKIYRSKIYRSKILRIFLKVLFYISQILDIIYKSLSIYKKKRIKSVLIIVDAGPCMVASLFLLFLMKKPIDLYFFDIYAGNSTATKMSAVVANFIQGILVKKSRYLFFIWEDMKIYFANLYPQFSYKMHTIPSSIIFDKYQHYKNLLNQNNKFRGQLKICYAGIIGKSQMDVIRVFVQILKNKKEWELYLFTPYIPEEIEKMKKEGLIGDNIFFDYVKGDEIISKYKNADILLFPFSFNKEMKLIVSTIVGGKILEYLASGTPIMVVAPSYAAISKFFINYKLGIVINELSPITIQEKLNDFLHNRELYKDLAIEAQKIARDFFDAKRNCRTLLQFLFS